MTLNFIMPSQRKRIGFLPSEEVQEIIEKLCKDNEFSQSKITGLLVEEALRSRGVLRDSFTLNKLSDRDFINYSFEKELLSKNKKPGNVDVFSVNKKTITDNIKMMQEFVEFKYFKKFMKQNKDILE